jgi:chemotaxis protein MotB
MRLLASLALALALTGCVSMDRFKKKEAEASKFRQDWEDEVANRAVLKEKIAAMQQQLDALTAEESALRDKIRSDEGTLTQKESELRAARDRLLEMQALVDELSKSKKKLEAAKAELEKKSGEYEQLATALRGEIDAGRVELMELRGRTTVKMKDKILFASGSATIGADGRDALKKVAQALRGLQAKAVRVEGHTDNVPIGAGGPFPQLGALLRPRPRGRPVPPGDGRRSDPPLRRRVRRVPADLRERHAGREEPQPPDRDHPRADRGRPPRGVSRRAPGDHGPAGACGPPAARREAREEDLASGPAGFTSRRARTGSGRSPRARRRRCSRLPPPRPARRAAAPRGGPS